MRVLVTYGTKMGGTAGIAEILGDALSDAGFHVDMRPTADVADVGAYDAVVVGGAVYAGRWHRDARRFVKRNTRVLRDRPVWLFSSGPLDGSASYEEILPVEQVRQLLERVGAAGHATFGGRLRRDAKGFPASAMAKTHAGDWRDPVHIRAWAAKLALELRLDRREPLRA
jgi:menaquinone-dependent protoporphyrinogen oxidase